MLELPAKDNGYYLWQALLEYTVITHAKGLTASSSDSMMRSSSLSWSSSGTPAAMALYMAHSQVSDPYLLVSSLFVLPLPLSEQIATGKLQMQWPTKSSLSSLFAIVHHLQRDAHIACACLLHNSKLVPNR